MADPAEDPSDSRERLPLEAAPPSAGVDGHHGRAADGLGVARLRRSDSAERRPPRPEMEGEAPPGGLSSAEREALLALPSARSSALGPPLGVPSALPGDSSGVRGGLVYGHAPEAQLSAEARSGLGG